MTATTAVRQEIEQRVREFEEAFNRGDMAGLAANYTEDAVIMPPDSDSITGRQAIQQFWQSVWDSGIHEATLQVQQVEGQGDQVAEIGTAELSSPSGKIPLKYVVVWQRTGGRWMLAIDIWNTRAS